MSAEKHVTKRKSAKNNQKEEKPPKSGREEKPSKTGKEQKTSEPDLKYGPLPRFSGQRVWTRGILIIGVLIYVWYFSKETKPTKLAKQSELYNKRGQIVECSTEFVDDIRHYPGCLPNNCGRYVGDKIVTSQEADTLLRLAQRIMALGGSSGGATIVDLHSGALSYQDKFINVYAHDKDILTPTDKTIYQLVRKKIQGAIAESFGINPNSLYLTHPTFFSKLTNVDPKTIHDEYWHPHIDKHTYESFHYTSLLYLSDYDVDFKGGQFIFMNDINKSTKNVTVEPRTGRVLMFTSGSENPHFVERVSEGVRWAITISFTCDSSLAINDPLTK